MKTPPTRESAKQDLLNSTTRKDRVTDELIDTVFEYQKHSWEYYKRIWSATFGGDPELRFKNLSKDLPGGKHMSEQIPKLKQPALVVWGTGDLVPFERGVWLFNTLPNARIFGASGGHAPHVEHSEMFNAVLTSFLKEPSLLA